MEGVRIPGDAMKGINPFTMQEQSSRPSRRARTVRAIKYAVS
jgi:hypothetical protein